MLVMMVQLLTCLQQYPTVNIYFFLTMKAKIVDQKGFILTVEFDNEGQKWTKKMDMTNQGLNNLEKFFDEYCEAYLRGKGIENQPIQNVKGQTFEFVKPEK